MEDVSPALLERIRKDFVALLENTKWSGSTYTEASEYADAVGNALAEAFRRHLTPDALPDGKLYWNIAEHVVRPMLEEDHKLIADAAQAAQQALNEKAGIGLQAQRTPLNEDKVSGILNKVASAEQFDEVSWVFDEPVKTFSRSVVDSTLKLNAEFQSKAGLRPRIIRRAESHCCKWCLNLNGVYDYPDVPDDVYRRHNRCRCTVDYDPGVGKRRQDVWSKQWKSAEEYDKIEKRKQIVQTTVLSSIVAHPARLASYTPERLFNTLIQDGYDIKPLKNGSLKNILFKDGGGYKVNFEDGGLLQYHPATNSHHHGAYYKISTGKGGTHRYDLNGYEIDD